MSCPDGIRISGVDEMDDEHVAARIDGNLVRGLPSQYAPQGGLVA